MTDRMAWALQPTTWRMLAKLGLVLGVETLAVPPLWLAMRLCADRERVLEAQNAFRRRALKWLLPGLPAR
jgi:hypothetical protein